MPRSPSRGFVGREVGPADRDGIKNGLVGSAKGFRFLRWVMEHS